MFAFMIIFIIHSVLASEIEDCSALLNRNIARSEIRQIQDGYGLRFHDLTLNRIRVVTRPSVIYSWTTPPYLNFFEGGGVRLSVRLENIDGESFDVVKIQEKTLTRQENDVRQFIERHAQVRFVFRAPDGNSLMAAEKGPYGVTLDSDGEYRVRLEMDFERPAVCLLRDVVVVSLQGELRKEHLEALAQRLENAVLYGDMTSFAKVIAEVKVALNASDHDIAELGGVGYRTVGRWIREVSAPHHLIRHAIYRIFAKALRKKAEGGI